MSAKVTPAELLRRGLEFGIFDDAPQFKKDAKACLKAPPKLRVWLLSMDGDRLSDPSVGLYYSKRDCYDAVLFALALDPPEDETEEERETAQRLLERGEFTLLQEWISEHDEDFSYCIETAEMEPGKAEAVQ